MKKTPLIFCATWLASAYCLADTTDLPKVKIGDTWTYQNTQEKAPNTWNQIKEEIVVTRVAPSSILSSIKISGSTQAPREVLSGRDWTFSRSFDGNDTIVYKPLSFPLSIGKTWELKFTHPHPSPSIKYYRWEINYAVSETETVVVPAGKFTAIKIEGEGRWFDEIEPGQTVIQSANTTPNGTSMMTEAKKISEMKRTGKLYHAYWYVPDIKRWVKSVEESYSPEGVRGERRTSELVAFKSGE